MDKTCLSTETLTETDGHRLEESLATSGLRSTRQRHHVYDALLQKRDHPTAEEVFIRAKERMTDISLATVYNCLDTLVQCGLVRQVNLDRAPTRYCPNMEEHCHFYCDHCGRAFDIDLPSDRLPAEIQMLKGFKATRYEIGIRGTCSDCASKSSS